MPLQAFQQAPQFVAADQAAQKLTERGLDGVVVGEGGSEVVVAFVLEAFAYVF